MKKSLLAMTALAAMLFAGCTSSDELTTLESIKQAENAPTPISFGTYMGKSGSTRAGYVGNIAIDQLQTNSFGVFAYYTPKDGSSKYTYWNTCTASNNSTKLTSDYSSAIAANFMFNQKVEYKNTSGNVSAWEYEPLKYWPNDFNNSGVDDASPAAYGSGENGNVSFFAYAPYVDFSSTAVYGITGSSPASGTTYGITAINGETTLTAANVKSQDPTLTYTLNSKYPVDLLWGTAGTTSPNVNASSQIGRYTVWSNGTTVSKYPVNVNLNKQKTGGTIDFAFKHALAAFGGGSTVSGGGGFQVQLDLDDMQGGETGGTREQFNTTGSTPDNAWRTIVTIKNIEISNDLNANGSIDGGEVGQASSGTFNLATGEWTATPNQVVSQKIGTIAYDATMDAELNAKIAEYFDNTKTWLENLTSSNVVDYFAFTNAENANSQHPGVMETAMNVYNESTRSPLLFIPGTVQPKLRITVDYIVRTYDANLSTSYTEVEQKISKQITFPTPFEMNKKYNIIMHLGLTGVKFTATVSSWDDGHIGTAGGGSGASSDDVYLPINVQ